VALGTRSGRPRARGSSGLVLAAAAAAAAGAAAMFSRFLFGLPEAPAVLWDGTRPHMACCQINSFLAASSSSLSAHDLGFALLARARVVVLTLFCRPSHGSARRVGESL